MESRTSSATLDGGTATANPAVRAHIGALSMLRPLFKQLVGNDLDAAALTWHAGASASHIHWLIGHMGWAIDRLVNGHLGTAPALPATYDRIFSYGATPDAKAEGYPAAEVLIREFDQVTEAAIRSLESLGDAHLERRLPESSPVAALFPTYGALFHGLFFHTAYHLGQVSLLRRAQGRASNFGA